MPAFEDFLGDMHLYQERLHELFKHRRAAAKKGELKEVFRIQEGQDFYQEVVQKIGGLLFFLKENYGDKFSNCPLFEVLDSEVKLREFEQNFYKLFIDRDNCRDGEKAALQFNRYSFEGNSRGADLCYAESFAVAFYTMLVVVANKLKDDADYKLLNEEVIEMFNLFNFTLTNCDPDSDLESMRFFGAQVTYEEVLKRQIMQDCFGENRLFYHFPNCYFQASMEKDFDHERAIVFYYHKYREEISDPDSDKGAALFKFVDDVSSAAHLCPDGNTRSAIILGWMLSLLHNHEFVVGAYQNFADDQLIIEGKKWTQEFFSNPTIPVMSKRELEIYSAVRAQNSAKKDAASVCFNFVTHTFGLSFGEPVFFQIPIDLEHDLLVGTSYEVDKAVVIAQRGRHFIDAEGIELKGFMKLVAENLAEINAEPDVEKSYAKLAMRYMLQIEESFEEGFLRGNALNTIEHFRRAYPLKVFQGSEMEKDYRRVAAFCDEIEEGKDPSSVKRDGRDANHPAARDVVGESAQAVVLTSDKNRVPD